MGFFVLGGDDLVAQAWFLGSAAGKLSVLRETT